MVYPNRLLVLSCVLQDCFSKSRICIDLQGATTNIFVPEHVFSRRYRRSLSNSQRTSRPGNMTRRRPGTGTRGRSGDWQPPSRGALWRATPLAAVSAVVAILLNKPLRYCAFLTFRIFFSDRKFLHIHGNRCGWGIIPGIPVQPFGCSQLSAEQL